MENKKKTAKQMERHFKGISNHHRIDIMLLVAEAPRISVDQISNALNSNFKTTSEHTRRLVQAGLLNKEYQGRTVAHSLSPYGGEFVKFIKQLQTFQYS